VHGAGREATDLLAHRTERFEQYLELAGWVDSPWLGLNFDIGHAFCTGEDPAEWVPRMAQHTRHYHIEDIAPDRRHAREIKRSGYNGFVTVELYPFVDQPDQAGREARDYLQRWLDQLAADDSKPQDS